MPVAVDTSGRLYDDFLRLLFLHAPRKAIALAGELPEESDQFRVLRAACLDNIKSSVGLNLAKASVMRVTILSTYLRGLSYLSLASFSCTPSSYSFPSRISSTLCLSGT